MDIESIFREICVERPLYSEFIKDEHKITGKDGAILYVTDIINSQRIQFDCFCVWCGQNSTFIRGGRNSSGTGYSNYVFAAPGTFVVKMSCTRNSNHSYLTWFQETGNGIRKIGMSPSMEDISTSDLKKYRGLLSKDYFSELHRAGGLASHGIGIGSFVYLRRIFEKQIADHYERRVAERGQIDGFSTMRVDEKIEAISDYLPETLVKHRLVYSILSKGVHELDEKTCLSYYPPLRQAIIMILEQDYQIREREKVARELEKSLSYISTDISNSFMQK